MPTLTSGFGVHRNVCEKEPPPPPMMDSDHEMEPTQKILVVQASCPGTCLSS